MPHQNRLQTHARNGKVPRPALLPASQSLANIALDRLNHLRSEAEKNNVRMDYLIFINLTATKWVSEKLKGPEKDAVIEKFKRSISHFYRMLYSKVFPRGKSEFALMRTIHPCRSSKPLEPHLHVHTVMPNLAIPHHEWEEENPAGSGYLKMQRNSYHRIRPFIDEKLIKETWRRVLEDHGLWNQEDEGIPVVNIESIKFRGSGGVATKRAIEDNNRIHHKLSYMCRLPIEDLNRNLTDEDLEDLDIEWARFLFNYTTRRANLGFMHDLKRLEYNSNKSISFRCPICHSGMIYIGKIESNLPEIPHLIRENDGRWIEVEPPLRLEEDKRSSMNSST